VKETATAEQSGAGAGIRLIGAIAAYALPVVPFVGLLLVLGADPKRRLIPRT
jgi:hypothetical protein